MHFFALVEKLNSWLTHVFSIRLIFSIADIQNPEESELEQEESEGESSEDELSTSYPLRCSFSISKVCFFLALFMTCALLTPIFLCV